MSYSDIGIITSLAFSVVIGIYMGRNLIAGNLRAILGGAIAAVPSVFVKMSDAKPYYSGRRADSMLLNDSIAEGFGHFLALCLICSFIVAIARGFTKGKTI
jgi:hypothetical protein